jgi:hypothetical protein
MTKYRVQKAETSESYYIQRKKLIWWQTLDNRVHYWWTDKHTWVTQGKLKNITEVLARLNLLKKDLEGTITIAQSRSIDDLYNAILESQK